MVLTVKVSLQDYTTEEYAKELGVAITSQVKEGVGNLSTSPIKKVQVGMKDTDGNNLSSPNFV